MTMNAFGLTLLALLMASLRSASGHGTVIKPVPRSGPQKYCPWCTGGHAGDQNRAGAVHRDAKLDTPCAGSSRGGAIATKEQFSIYSSWYPSTEERYAPGGSFSAKIILDADHNGDAIWQFCPHSETETEDCFNKNPLGDWTDVHSAWDASNTVDHWKDGRYYTQEVTLPSGISGAATLRWKWVTKYTDEIFVSCIDVNIGSGGSKPETEQQPEKEDTTEPSPPHAVPGAESHYCYIKACGCPPFTGKPDWCDPTEHRIKSQWCNENEGNCAQCNGEHCDVASQGLTLAAIAFFDDNTGNNTGDVLSGGKVWAPLTFMTLLGLGVALV